MPALPSSIALAQPADGSLLVASDPRTAYTSIQTAVNALITALSGGTVGQVLTSSGGTTVGWAAGGTVGADLVAPASLATFTNITAATEATANTFATLPSYTADGATVVAVEAEFYATKGTTWISFSLWDNGVDQGLFGVSLALSGTWPVRFSRMLTPSAGAHVYTLRAHVDAGTGTAGGGAGGVGVLLPGYARLVRAA